jgi:EmrB/QacA subfamily drug resistance transporter
MNVMDEAVEGFLAYKWKVMVTIAVGTWMIVLDSTVVNVAFPTLRTIFEASVDETQWIISVYVLALGIATPLAGFLADRFGLKRVYVVGLAVFVVGSLWSGLSPTLWSLVAARAVQGLGGGIAQPLSIAMLFMAFPPREQGYAFGVFGVIMVGAPALGPILGGLLVDHDLWRWIFFVNVPVGLLGIALALRWLRAPMEPRYASLNLLSVAIALAGFGGVLYAASVAGRYGWMSARVLVTLGTGIAALASFAVLELKFSRDPVLELRLFANRTFRNANLVGYVSVVALFGAEFIMPIYLQALRGRTALESGLMLLPLAIAAAVINPIAGRLYDAIGPRLLVATGGTVLIVNTWLLRGLSAVTTTTAILALMAMRGAAISLIMQSTYTTALGSVSHRSIPRGSSLVNSTRFIAQALSVAVLATILSTSLSAETRRMQDESIPSAAAGLCETDALKRDPADRTPTTQACDEYLRGISRTYTATFVAALAALGVGLSLPGWPGEWHGREALNRGVL